MKPVLILDGKEIDIASISFRNDEISSVSYFDDKGKHTALFDKKYKLDGYETIDNLAEKIIFKDDSKDKIVQAIKEFLADEEKLLNLKDGEVAEANRELYGGSTNWKRFIDYSLTRQEQFGRVDAIIDTLNLVKLTLGYKD